MIPLDVPRVQRHSGNKMHVRMVIRHRTLNGRPLKMLVRPAMKFYREEMSKGKNIYKIIYSGFFEVAKKRRKCLKILARPAGLEPATPCLEVPFQQGPPMLVLLGIFDLLYSTNYRRLVEACGALLSL